MSFGSAGSLSHSVGPVRKHQHRVRLVHGLHRESGTLFPCIEVLVTVSCVADQDTSLVELYFSTVAPYSSPFVLLSPHSPHPRLTQPLVFSRFWEKDVALLLELSALSLAREAVPDDEIVQVLVSCPWN